MAKNPRIKRANVVVELTPEQQLEVDRCMYGYIDPETGKYDSGPVYFAKNYVRIQHPTKGDIPFLLYDYQERMINTFLTNNKTVVLSARQTGKCVDGNTTISIAKPLGGGFMSFIKKITLWIIDKPLYRKLYG